MRTISKIICWIFVIFVLFIVVNLVIWAVHYWWTKKYSEYLNSRNRDDSIAQVYILKPQTWLSIFYEIDWLNAEINNNQNTQVENIESNETLSWDNWDNTEIKEENHNPYDPDYENEFNSFFWWSAEENSEVIPVEEIESLEPAGFVADDGTEN